MMRRNTDKDWLLVVEGFKPNIIQGPVSTQLLRKKVGSFLERNTAFFLGFSAINRSIFIGSEEWLSNLSENLTIGENKDAIRL